MESDAPAELPAQEVPASTQEKPGQPTTHVRNLNGELVAWDAVKDALLVEKLTVTATAERFHVKAKTIYERASKKGWRITNAHTRRARAKLAKKVHDKIIKLGPDSVDWTKKGEEHRSLAFQIAHDSVAKFKPRAPKTFRELEAADKIARRAAGLEVEGVTQNNTLIQVNELINEAEPRVREASEVPPNPSEEEGVVEAEIISEESGSEDQPLLEDGQSPSQTLSSHTQPTETDSPQPSEVSPVSPAPPQP